ncbi:TenA family protein [Micromonospora thermarum]|uniref:TenA family transcriptional regulator n=1 Tax=Micromonospora thermarum TaxID=2720024 RepID=A0ABX0ZBL3_9ACTN|nr:TenA family transcriptional regulator [Micromonospora thermarum]NJP33368.1 TenA family transcriptional regulator [Micromonospora thermarum]
MPLHDELREIRDPVLRKVQDHPFWSGIRDGSLPPAALAHFLAQDTGYLLPTYARALARCAAAADADAHTLLLGQSVAGTLDARDRLRANSAALAATTGLPETLGDPPIDPVTRAHTAFLTAATADSFAGGVGALLPMVWFNAEVSNRLLRDTVTDSRYRPWVEAYHPGESYRYAVQAFLDMADDVGKNGTARERADLIEQFSISIRYEWAFAESCTASLSDGGDRRLPFEESTREGTR